MSLRRGAGVTGVLERVNGFWRTVIVLVLVYFLLRFAFGYASQVITGADGPQPIPGALLTIYMALVLLGLAVQVAVSEESLRDFRDPLVALLGGGEEWTGSPAARWGRFALLALPPILVALAVYRQLAPSVVSPTLSRQQHPTLPESYVAIENPYRELPEAEQSAAIAEGIVLYQRNCRPCHGTPVNGSGELAGGYRPRPVAFVDPGTIDSVVESYLIWRIEEGGLGLPSEGTPWHSAMPPWKDELERDDIWKIIMAEYDIAGKEPRVPEAIH
jgi:mono/diheme cytochrome c family protein